MAQAAILEKWVFTPKEKIGGKLIHSINVS